MVGFLAGLLAAALVMGAVLLVGAGGLHLAAVIVTGLVVGSLGRVAFPGRDPAGTTPTVLVGVGGSVLGGFGGWFLFVGSRPASLVCSVGGAASIMWLVRRQAGAGIV